MITLVRTTSDNPDFKELVKALDIELKILDGEDHSFYAQYNKIDSIKYVVLAYENTIVVGCGAIKEYAANTMEVKRMFVPLAFRKKGIAGMILRELEKWCGELNYPKCILETGINQQEAIGLYNKHNYKRIPNYGQYVNVVKSLCFEKEISIAGN